MKIPKSWADVTIEQYQQLCNNIADKSLTELELIISNITTLCHIDYKDIEKKPLKETLDIANQLSFIGEQYKGQFINSFIIENNIFHVHADVTQLTYGQFKDLSELSKDSSANLHHIMAIFCYKKGTSYDIDYFDRSELFKKKLTMDKVLPLSAFFLELYQRFVMTSQHYSLMKVEKILKETGQEIQSLVQSSDSAKGSDGLT